MERQFLPYSRQCIDESDIRAVENVLRSDFVTRGPLAGEFEKALAEVCGARGACVVSTGSAAVHAACHALGVGVGKEILLPNNTFVATANAVAHCGGTPVLVDSEPNALHMSLSDLELRITPATAGIIAMHYGGMPCDMEHLSRLAEARGLWILEDAAHAIGATFKGNPVGSCTYSRAATFSFHPVKPLCTGEGGAILSNDVDILACAKRFASGGITKDPALFVHPENVSPWYVEQQELGFNYSLTEMQCALGLSQLKRLDDFIDRRNAVARRYQERLVVHPQIAMPLADRIADSKCAYHIFPVIIEFEALGKTRAEVMTVLKGKKIGTQVLYIPLSMQPYYRERMGVRDGDFPMSEEVYRKMLALPISAVMDDDDVDYVCESLVQVLEL